MIFEKIRERLQKAESVKCYGSINSGNYMIPLDEALKIINQVEAEYKEVITNADRIRQMTDEELALFLVNFKNTFGEEYEGEMSCLEWLRKEAYVAIAKNATPIKDSIMNHFTKGE